MIRPVLENYGKNVKTTSSSRFNLILGIYALILDIYDTNLDDKSANAMLMSLSFLVLGLFTITGFVTSLWTITYSGIVTTLL